MPLQPGLEDRKELLNRVEIRRIWGQIQDHNALLLAESSDVGGMMCGAIVHDENRLWAREWVAAREDFVLKEPLEPSTVDTALMDMIAKDTV
ncbi:hypothetical protein HO173_003266 [Letharia columbiana]|uniref:Uncharacterized protein n=1 Tax=Letharia columbiana TaxID=112416 RepID=A0A8H6G1F5_9LECA|nr:uncharacterized protein HO173_003266 [Letharia columbiana]KAF6238759.1 hypothetical protein HO173_003266 [Letharia columbiana]